MGLLFYSPLVISFTYILISDKHIRSLLEHTKLYRTCPCYPLQSLPEDRSWGNNSLTDFMSPELPKYQNSTKTFQENCRSVGLSNIEAKILSKRQHICHHTKCERWWCCGRMFCLLSTVRFVSLHALFWALVYVVKKSDLLSSFIQSVHVLINSFNKYFLNMYNVSDIIPGTGEYSSEKNRPNSCSSGIYILLGKQIIKKIYL